jgi:hypothetical protein
METLNRLNEITIRLDQIESSAEWLSRLLVQIDPSASQAGSLINTLSSDIRDRLVQLITEFELHMDTLRQGLH